MVERNTGERPHSLVMGNVVVSIHNGWPDLFVWPILRVITMPGRRTRVPDVCVTRADFRENVLAQPPFLAIEILSPQDRMTDVLEKLSEYEAFGVPHIWLLDPYSEKAYSYERACLKVVGAPSISAGEIHLDLAEIFRDM